MDDQIHDFWTTRSSKKRVNLDFFSNAKTIPLSSCVTVTQMTDECFDKENGYAFSIGGGVIDKKEDQPLITGTSLDMMNMITGEKFSVFLSLANAECPVTCRYVTSPTTDPEISPLNIYPVSAPREFITEHFLSIDPMINKKEVRKCFMKYLYTHTGAMVFEVMLNESKVRTTPSKSILGNPVLIPLPSSTRTWEAFKPFIQDALNLTVPVWANRKSPIMLEKLVTVGVKLGRFFMNSNFNEGESCKLGLSPRLGFLLGASDNESEPVFIELEGKDSYKAPFRFNFDEGIHSVQMSMPSFLVPQHNGDGYRPVLTVIPLSPSSKGRKCIEPDNPLPALVGQGEFESINFQLVDNFYRQIKTSEFSLPSRATILLQRINNE